MWRDWWELEKAVEAEKRRKHPIRYFLPSVIFFSIVFAFFGFAFYGMVMFFR